MMTGNQRVRKKEGERERLESAHRKTIIGERYLSEMREGYQIVYIYLHCRWFILLVFGALSTCWPCAITPSSPLFARLSSE